MSKKPVIVFEGIEGSGKSYHIKSICNYLKRKNIKFLKLREPGGSINSEKIRKLILNNNSNFNKNTDLLLYLAARSENLELIKKNYKKKMILIDRFLDSTLAYQHYGFGIDKSLIEHVNRYLLGDIKIDYTFLNIVNHKNMFSRLKERKKLNRYDKFNKKFYENVQKGFIKIINKKKKNSFCIINSNMDKNSNKKIVLNKIKKFIK